MAGRGKRRHGSAKVGAASIWLIVGVFLLAGTLSGWRTVEVKADEESLIQGQFWGNQGVYEEIWAVVTGYSSSPDETDDTPFVTASGTSTRPGIVACPRRYLFGTLALIGGKIYECEDRLNPKYDNRFDIWHGSKGEAWEFGANKVLVKLLRRN